MDNDSALSIASVLLDFENLGSDTVAWMHGNSTARQVLIDAYKLVIDSATVLKSLEDGPEGAALKKLA
jgi:hypothetical protein